MQYQISIFIMRQPLTVHATLERLRHFGDTMVMMLPRLRGFYIALLLILCPLLLIGCSAEQLPVGVEPLTAYLQQDMDTVLKDLKLTVAENATVLSEENGLSLKLQKPQSTMGAEFQVVLQFTPADVGEALSNRLDSFTYTMDFSGKDTKEIANAVGAVLAKMQAAYTPFLGQYEESFTKTKGTLTEGAAPAKPFDTNTIEQLLDELEADGYNSTLMAQWTLPKLMEHTNMPDATKSALSHELAYKINASLTHEAGQYTFNITHALIRARA